MMNRIVWILLLVLFCNIPAIAQEEVQAIPRRDPLQLAQSLLGYTGDAVMLELSPVYQPGDMLEFWVGKSGEATPTRITTTLVGSTARSYIWVDNAIQIQMQDPSAVALSVAQVYTLLRMRSSYRSIALPGLENFQDATDLLPVPDVDNDERLFVVFTTGLVDDRDVLINPMDSIPTVYTPSGINNQHETMFVNVIEGTPLDSGLYLSAIMRGLFSMVRYEMNPDTAAWFDEMMSWWIVLTPQVALTAEDYNSFLIAPDTPLIQPATLTTRIQTLAAQQLFLRYIAQRYGEGFFAELFLRFGRGLDILDGILAEDNIYDLVTGAPVTGLDLFADFTLATLLNLDFGDRRYGLTVGPVSGDQRAVVTAIESVNLPSLTVSQFGSVYYRYTNSTSTAANIEVTFTGRQTVDRLPMDHDPVDSFYWSGWGGDQVRSLTQSFDLSGVESATLAFDAWYNMADNWNYGYVSASTDGGTTWTILAPQGVTPNNRYGAAYGVGFTGMSNAEPSHPFPIMGVVLSSDGVTVLDVVEAGAADAAGVQPNDLIVGYEGERWQASPDVFGMLAHYAPGDTLNLLIERGDEMLEFPVVLGAHPTRMTVTQPRWASHTVDLTPYTGGEVLIRFMTITLPGREDQGFAVDNISVPEIDYVDSGDGDLWEKVGWSQIDNQLPQEMLVQGVTVGSTAGTLPRVTRLINGTNENGSWTFPLDAGEILLIGVSGVNDETYERATFDLSFNAD